MYDFPAPNPVRASLRLPNGVLTMHAEERDTVEVTVEPGDTSEAAREAATKTKVEMNGDQLVIETAESRGFRLFWRNPKINITVRLPRDSTANVKLASADGRLHGRYADVRIASASGDVQLEECSGDVSLHTASGTARVGRVSGSLKAHSASGDLELGDVDRDVTAHSASGDIQVGEVLGGVFANTASGDIRVGPVGGSVKANSASGDIEIGSTRSGLVKVHSASGDVRVGVLAGTAVWLDLSTASGRTTSDLNVTAPAAGPVGGDSQLTLQIRTASGDIEVRRVHAVA
jgi:DUF4097 and DUF4098 domain-containing protein YvlB